MLVYAARLVAAATIRAWLAGYHRLRIAGRENLPTQGSFVLVAHHASHVDTLCLLSALSPCSRWPATLWRPPPLHARRSPMTTAQTAQPTEHTITLWDGTELFCRAWRALARQCATDPLPAPSAWRQTMKLSALTSSLPMPLPEAIAALAELGFRWIDVPPTADPAARRALRERDLQVACVALERDRPHGVDPATEDGALRRRSVAYFWEAIARTAQLNAPAAYVTPPVASDAATLERWSESLLALADCAETHGVKLCVEHFPRRALPTVAATREFLDELQHNALALLIDVGHCLISNEDAAAAVIASGKRLGYLHCDDNDGVDDLHWALLDGRLTEAQLAAVIEAQRSAEYDGALCIELNPTLERPLENLRRSREILLRCAENC